MKYRSAALLLISAVLLCGCGTEKKASEASAPKQTATAAADDDEPGTIEAEDLTIPASSIDDAEFSLDTESAPLTETEPNESNYSDFVTLADYKGLKIEAPAGTVIEEGMTANIDYEGKAGGALFDGSTGTNYDLIVSSGSFMPGTGFEKQLVGRTAGDEFKISITMPKDHWNPAVAGKKADYKIRVNKVYYSTPDFVLARVISDSHVIQYPKSLYDEWIRFQKEQYSSLGIPGQTAEEAAADFGFSEENIIDTAYAEIKKTLVCRAIIAAEGIRDSDPLYAEAQQTILDRYGFEDMKDFLDVGYMQLEIDQLVEQELAQRILVNYEAA